MNRVATCKNWTGCGARQALKPTGAKHHQTNTFSTADIDDDDDNSDDNDNNQPTATMPTRTAAAATAAASMTRTCIFVLMWTASRYKCYLTHWNTASRLAPDRHSRCAVQREEWIDLWLSQLMKLEARALNPMSTTRGKATMIGHSTWLLLCMPNTVRHHDFPCLLRKHWDQKLLTVGYVNKLYALVKPPSHILIRVLLG